ncbi:SUN domain-containing protein 1 isoform X10 [Ambystoma mexicanum]
MSRRSLRLVTTAGYYANEDIQNDSINSNSFNVSVSSSKSSRTTKQQRNINKQSTATIHHTPRKNLSNTSLLSHSSLNSHLSDTSLVSTVLDETLIREQTEVDHFWGLDDDGDLRVGESTMIQANGGLSTAETQTTLDNGYTCNDCSMLSEQKDTLAAYSTQTSTVYSRDRSHKQKSGKAASRSFWWLGTGWYQLVTWISLFNVFLLTRCLPKAFKLLLLLIPLLLLFGLWYSGLEGIMSLLPLLIGANVRTEKSEESSIPTEQPDFSGSCPPPKITMQFDSHRVTELEQQIAVLSGKYHLHIEEYSKVVMTLQKVEQQVAQMDDKSGMSAMITNILSQHFKAPAPGQGTFTMDEFQAFHKNHDERILKLEDIFAKLATKSEELKQELEIVKSRSTASALDEENESLMKKVQHLELELAEIKSELLNWQGFKTSCEKIHTIQEQVDAQIKDSVKVMFFGNREDELPESLLQWLSSKCVSKSEFQPSLLDLELRIFKNISHYVAATNKMPDLDVVQSAVTGGISGITAEQARIIVNNALKLYSQDKTGMVDYALESGGGSILSTRCSETYETKTALMSLFGIPLWYFSQSPRVVIQPDMYPGNCWAFKGSQGYLVVRLSMKIYPAAFTLEHIPKTLSPTGNITSAPKDFTVYGLEDEYQEEGKLLGQYTYNQEGEPLQTFQVTEENESAFQIVELRILSNWGHTEYTCLYRFRVHGSNDI